MTADRKKTTLITDTIRIAALPEQSRPFARTLSRRMGRLLNIHARMGESPTVIAAYSGIRDAIDRYGTLDARTRETVALAVGNQNGCDYCQSAHTLSARRAGLGDEEIVKIRAGSIDFDARLAAIAAVARSIAGHVGNVPESLRRQADDAGWSTAQLEELLAHVAVNLYTNYFNHYAHTSLDVPAAPPLG